MRSFIVFLLIFLKYTISVNTKCSKESFYLEDITHGYKDGTNIIKDDIKYDKTNYFYENDKIYGCVCDIKKCLRKCCADGEYPSRINKTRFCTNDNNSRNVKSLKRIFKENEETKHYNLVHSKIICSTIDTLAVPIVDLNKELHDGIFDAFGMSFNYENFCLDYVQNKLTSIICFTSEEEELFTSVGMIISMPFLLITFIVYALLPDRNLHMKALMCYVFNLLFAYIFLVTIQLTDQAIENTLCSILGYGCIFFFLSSFFWMNVICVDIFLGFRGFRGVPGVRSSERRRFLLYCLYAWGMSLLIVGITFFLNSVGKNDRWYFPGVSVGQCFIRNGLPQLLYFYGPMGFVIIFNVLLFTLTALKIRQVKKDTSMLKHSESKRHSDDDQQNFYLYMKLLLAMGVNWTMELISWAVGLNNNTVPAYVWYLSDFCNATYGVFIFFIFVFKRNIWKQLKRRYYNFTGRHHLAHSMATTNVTKITSDSMTVSTNDRAL